MNRRIKLFLWDKYSLFKPIDHTVAKIFGISDNLPLFLFSAQYLNDPRKGLDFLMHYLK